MGDGGEKRTRRHELVGQVEDGKGRGKKYVARTERGERGKRVKDKQERGRKQDIKGD